MTKTLMRFSALAMLCLFFACQKKFSRETNLSGRLTHSVEGCDTVRYPLIDFAFAFGEVAVWNDADNVYIRFTANPGGKLAQASGIIGDYAHLQAVLSDDVSEATGPVPPDFAQTFDPEVQTYTFTLPAATVFANSDCVWLNVHAIVHERDANGNITFTKYLWAEAPEYITSYQHSRSFPYCRMTCEPPPPPPGDCGALRTQTPGGWGAEPNGNNPGTYLHANFNTVFPNGLTVGCYPGNYYVRLTTAQAITNLLPTGGQAAVLKANSTNPAAMKNVLVGHLIALKLSVGFDENDPDFGQAGVALGAMKIGSGLFKDWTVLQFLTEADKVLGGCSNAYTAVQVLETANAINENYLDGKVDKGFLVCPVED